MSNFLKKNIQELLKKQGISPLKSLGQNFLIDESAIKKVVLAGDIKPDDVILEVGPGLGALTQELAKKAKMVVAVEKDLKMAELLKKTLGEINNVEVINEDVFNFPLEEHILGDYKVIANPPFHRAANFIRKFLESEKQPEEMVLFVQKEVGQRICAKPPKMSILAVSVQIYAEPRIVSYISKKSFFPAPKVDSAIIKISKIPSLITKSNNELFFKVVRAGFSQPRKQLINNLSKGLKMEREKVKNWLLENGIQPSQRAETLKVEDWIKLVKGLK